jgi:hypothetical protein
MNREEIFKKAIEENPNCSISELSILIKENNPEIKMKMNSLNRRIHEYVKLHKINLNPDYDLKTKIEQDKNKNRLSLSHKEYKEKYEQVLKDLEISEKRFEIWNDCKNSNSYIYDIPFKEKNTSQSIVLISASDWHCGEVVNPQTVNGLNEFNKDIFKKRVTKFFQSIATLIEIERKATHIDTLILNLLGDLITGYIHEELLESSDLSPTESILLCRDLLKSGFDFLVSNCNVILDIETTLSNHGRTTDKKRYSTSYKNSFEWLMYMILKSEYQGNKKIRFNIGTSYHNWYTLYDKYPIRIHHGDAVNYQGGIGGITIPMNKAINEWNKAKMAYLDLTAHFHTFLFGGNFLSNSSLMGYSAFALNKKFAFEKPTQTFCLINKTHGLNCVRKIFVE